MTATPPRVPQLGDAVLCDGRLHQVTARRKRYSSETDSFVTGVQFENARFRVYALESDFRWSEELGAWYLWGRCLSPEAQQAVIELRKRGLLVQRTTHDPTHAPAGGEHLDLYLALVHGRAPGWLEVQVAAVQRGEAASPALVEAATEFAARWHGPHADGYAEPGDTPSTTAGRIPT